MQDAAARRAGGLSRSRSSSAQLAALPVDDAVGRAALQLRLDAARKKAAETSTNMAFACPS